MAIFHYWCVYVLTLYWAFSFMRDEVMNSISLRQRKIMRWFTLYSLVSCIDSLETNPLFQRIEMEYENEIHPQDLLKSLDLRSRDSKRSFRCISFSYSTQLLEITYMIKNDGNNDDNKTNNYNSIFLKQHQKK